MAPRMYAEPSTLQVNKARKKLRWNLEEPDLREATAGGEACGVNCETCAS